MEEQFSFGQYMADIAEASGGIVYMMIATLAISIIYIFLLKWFVKPILYTSMVLILASFVLLGGWSWIKRSEFDPELEKNNYQYATYGAAVAWTIGFLYLCFMCCCWKNISLGASIMEAASAFVGQNLRVLLLPIISYFISFAFLLYWIMTAAFLYSVGEPEFKEGSPIANIKWVKEIRYSMYFFVFGLFWVVAFIICMQQFIIAALTCMWYFYGQGNGKSDSNGEVSLLKAISWGMWYHCGSIAFGSFIIAVVTMIRVIFEYF